MCRVTNYGNGYTCSCLPRYFGTPPFCRAECVVDSDCPSNKACRDMHCVDPCPGVCGVNAYCTAINHAPVCTCNSGHEGDPFRYCSIPVKQHIPEPSDPCYPSPCGTNSVCTSRNNLESSCKCLPGYFGDPFIACKPECVVNSE